MRHSDSSLIAKLAGLLPRCIVLGTLLLTFRVGLGQPSAEPPVSSAPPPSVAHPPSRVSEECRNRLITTITDAFEEQKLVGLSFALVESSDIALELHLGYQDREAQIRAGSQTMYRWASISKPITAIAAMQLVLAGKLDLDADIRTYVPEFPARHGKVTARQLLTHQGGIVHYDNGEVVSLPKPQSPEHPYQDVVVALDRFKESPLVCKPGTRHEYTTHGYMLLGAVVQRAAGKAYWDYVREHVALPAGMETFQPDYQWIRIENRAVGYKAVGALRIPSTNTDVSWKLAGGGFISTTADLARFAGAAMDGRFVPISTLMEMCTPQKTIDGKKTRYGLGFGTGRLKNQVVAKHSGSQEKCRTMLVMVPELKLAVALMSNTESAELGPLSDQLMEMVLEDHDANKGN